MGVKNCFYCKNSIITTNQIKITTEKNNNNLNLSNEPINLSNSLTRAQNSIIGKKNISLKFDKSNFIRMKTKSLFDEYEIKEKLGEGAYGAVYKVQQRTTLFLRAVKAIKRKHVDSTSFSNEIAVLKTLDHPNIIKLFSKLLNNYFYSHIFL